MNAEDFEKKLAEIEARAAMALPPPWRSCAWDPMERPHVHKDLPEQKHCHPYSDLPMTPSDAEFIAHAREDVPWLIARARELQARLRDRFEHCGQLVEENQQLRERLAQAEKERDYAISEAYAYADERDKLKQELVAYEALSTDAVATIDKLRAEREMLSASIKTIDADNDQLTAENAKLRAELAKVKQAYSHLKGHHIAYECGECGEADCVYNDGLHYHHDSCPSEWVENQRLRSQLAIAREALQGLLTLHHDCETNYQGGYSQPHNLEVFQHGMHTICNVVEHIAREALAKLDALKGTAENFNGPAGVKQIEGDPVIDASGPPVGSQEIHLTPSTCEACGWCRCPGCDDCCRCGGIGRASR